MGKVVIPFGSRWKVSMPSGKKICTSRTKKYGNVGDIFSVFNHTFEITAVERRTLQDIAKALYKFEGCSNPDEFISVWRELHPYKGFVPEQVVYVHWFSVL